MKPNGILTLTTDFGLRDGYVGAMKGVVFGLSREVDVVDITHEIGRHDVVDGAYVLATVTPYYPEGTVHVGVVDPGVGSTRRAVAVQTRRSWLVGPDNGLLTIAAGDDIERIVELEAVPGFDGDRSATFHGRDLFAPAGGFLASGGDMGALGSELTSLNRLSLPKPKETPTGVEGEIIHIDGFGNVITNLDERDLPWSLTETMVISGGVEIANVVRCYSDVEPGSPCALVGSDGHLEIAVSQGSAKALLGLDKGDHVVCRKRL